MKGKKRKFGLPLMLLILLLLALSRPVSPASASPDTLQASGPCDPVGYVTNSLFGVGTTVNGVWPSAASMAVQQYWDNAYQQYPQAGRYNRVDTAQSGDVIILQPEAVVYPWNPTTRQVTPYTRIGGSAGHMGLVLVADWYGDLGGWVFLMRSAQWSSDWSVNSLVDDSCSNVTDSYVFVPSGAGVSFWRRTTPIAAPSATSTASPASSLLPPLTDVDFPSQVIAYPSDWPAELHYPDQFKLVAASSGSLPQGGAQGWAAKLIDAGTPERAASDLLAFLASAGWQVLDRQQLDTRGLHIFIQRGSKPQTGVILIGSDTQNVGNTRILVVIYL